MISLNCNKSINIFGNKKNTILELPSVGIGSNNTSNNGTYDYSLNFYTLVMELNSTTRSNYWMCKNSITFNNIVFKISCNTTHCFIRVNTSSMFEMNNCISINSPLKLRCDAGKGKLTNCYGNFASGTSTQDSQWKDQTDYITSTPQVDSTTYRITEDESVWKDKGTGTDPDGSPADLGIYGGEYSWEE